MLSNQVDICMIVTGAPGLVLSRPGGTILKDPKSAKVTG
jgi:hypothetical protein